ncbi:MAG TPA: single-stranded DNA-binding protein [Ruminococcaceae bacterium]|nr:single-stranded DNA-binding protein [Oscillospiraceae bacterium]
MNNMNISVAVERTYAKDKERVTDFFNVVVWRSTAKFIANYFEKSQMIALSGSLQVNKYKDRDGNPRQRTKVLVHQASFAGDKRNRTAPAVDVERDEPPEAEPYPDDPDLPF